MKNRLFIGIDVGGTKIAAGLADQNGRILSRVKYPTPKNAGSGEICKLIISAANKILRDSALSSLAIAGIGIGIPGIVDTEKGKIIKTPNINLSGSDLAQKMQKKFQTRVLMGNDVNLGLLGEKWFGIARNAKNIVGIFPGTGIGGAIISENKLISGTHGAAAEIGHMIMDLSGPECSCKNHGCLEAMASRWAIERDIKKKIKDGKKTIITELLGENPPAIKSKIIRQALSRKDPLTTEIVKKAALTLGQACISLRHIFDPQMFIFGGGLIEACGDFILPKIRKAVDQDPFFSGLPSCKIVKSQLGDDAIILGAVALIQEHAQTKLLSENNYPRLKLSQTNNILVDNKLQSKGFYLRADKKLKKLGKKMLRNSGGNISTLTLEGIAKICRKKPELLVLGEKPNQRLKIPANAADYLKLEEIEVKILPRKEAVDFYNQAKSRKAAIFI